MPVNTNSRLIYTILFGMAKQKNNHFKIPATWANQNRNRNKNTPNKKQNVIENISNREIAHIVLIKSLIFTTPKTPLPETCGKRFSMAYGKNCEQHTAQLWTIQMKTKKNYQTSPHQPTPSPLPFLSAICHAICVHSLRKYKFLCTDICLLLLFWLIATTRIR